MNKLISILVIIFLPAGAFGSELLQEQNSDHEKVRVFLRISRAASNVKSIVSEFSQEKHLSMMEKVLISKGRFYYEKPDRLRWEVIEPKCHGFVVNGDKAKRWRGTYVHQQSFELAQEPLIQVFVSQLIACASADFESLEQHYSIIVLEEDPAVLKLIPVSEKEKGYLDHLMLYFSYADSHVHTVEIHEPGGDFTRIKFMNTATNTEIQADIFDW